MRAACFLIFVACAHRPPTEALILVNLAEQKHDAAAMRALRSSDDAKALRADAAAKKRLADATRTTLGLWEAKGDYNEGDGFAELAKQLTGPTRLEGASSAELPLLAKVPIPVVMLSVDGKPPAAFIVDTGAAGLALNKAYCDRVGIPYLKDHPRTTHDGGGNLVTIFPAYVSSLSAQELAARDVEAVVIDLPPNFQIGGILSPQRVFGGALFELDFRDQKIRIQRDVTPEQWSATLGEAVERTPLTWDDGNVFVRVKLDQKVEGYMIFDSGASQTVVMTPVAEQLGHPIDPAKAIDSLSVTHHAAYPDITVEVTVEGGPPFKDTVAPIEHKAYPHLFDPPLGNVGMSWMKGRRLALTPDGRTLLYTAPRGTLTPPP
jgi:predicted aspartyl protease